MKFATLADGTRDGRLVLVSRDLTRAMPVPAVAPTLQAALDRWSDVEPVLRALAADLEDGRAASTEPFLPSQALAPLPRSHHWVDGSAYVNHGSRCR